MDASVAVAWILDSENTIALGVLSALESENAIVPGNFHTEVGHALVNAERRKLIHESTVTHAVENIHRLPIVVGLPPLGVIVATARRHGLTGYDAAYLALAMDRGMPLATLDGRLAIAAKSEKLLWKPRIKRR